MSDTEQQILNRIASTLPKLDETSKNRVMDFWDGYAFAVDRVHEQQPEKEPEEPK